MENDGRSIKQEAPSLPLGIFEIPGEPAVVINGVPDEPLTDSMIAKDEPISSGTVGSGEWLEGRQVRKFFCGQYYSGKVTKFDKESGWYRIAYEDGDSEDLDWSELEELRKVLLFTATITESEAYSTTVKAPYPGHKREKLTHLHFYFHDTISGDKPSAVVVARGPKTNSSATLFGLIAVADDPLTVGPDITSGEVGRAQGMYVPADQKNHGLFMAFNLVFTKGEFLGSTLAMYGRNLIYSKVREMPIIGGMGAFRFGSGYAQAKTFSFNTTSGDAVVEYNVYVWH